MDAASQGENVGRDACPVTNDAPDTDRDQLPPGGRVIEVDPSGRSIPGSERRRGGIPFLLGGAAHPELAALEFDDRVRLLERAAQGLHAAHRLGWIHGCLRGGDLRWLDRNGRDLLVVGGFADRAGATVGDDLADVGALIAALCSGDVSARGAQRRDVESVCAACAAREGGYLSAAHLAEDLGRLRRGRAVQARPDGAAGRLLRFAARRPMLAAALSIVAASTIVAIAGGLARAREVASDRMRLRSQAERTLALLGELDDHVGTGEIRDRLAATLLAQAELLAGDDEESRRMLIEAIIQAGTLARERDRPEEARLLRERAVSEAERLASIRPDSFDARRLLAHALVVQGDLEKERGDAEAGAARYERALAIEESLLAERPNDRGQLLRTGWGYERCAFLDARRPGGQVLAIARLNRVEELTSRLLAVEPADAEARWLSLMVRRHRIDLLEIRGATEEAEALRMTTIAELRALATDAGASRRFTTALAHWLAGEALRHASAGRRSEAVEAISEAMRTIAQAELGDGGSIDSDAVRLWVQTVATQVGLTSTGAATEATGTADSLARLRSLEGSDPRVKAFLRAFEEALGELVRSRPAPPRGDRLEAADGENEERGATEGPPG